MDLKKIELTLKKRPKNLSRSRDWRNHDFGFWFGEIVNDVRYLIDGSAEDCTDGGFEFSTKAGYGIGKVWMLSDEQMLVSNAIGDLATVPMPGPSATERHLVAHAIAAYLQAVA